MTVTPRRALAPLVGAAVAVAVLSGCVAAEPEPEPTAVFASEEEAFAAAEVTYRAYMYSQNRKRAEEEAPQPLSFLIGKALEAEIASSRRFQEQGITVVGSSELVSFTGKSFDLASSVPEVIADVCVDATGLRALDASGLDVAPSDRSPVVGYVVKLHEIEGELLISEISPGDVKC